MGQWLVVVDESLVFFGLGDVVWGAWCEVARLKRSCIIVGRGSLACVAATLDEIEKYWMFYVQTWIAQYCLKYCNIVKKEISFLA